MSLLYEVQKFQCDAYLMSIVESLMINPRRVRSFCLLSQKKATWKSCRLKIIECYNCVVYLHCRLCSLINLFVWLAILPRFWMTKTNGLETRIIEVLVWLIPCVEERLHGYVRFFALKLNCVENHSWHIWIGICGNYSFHIYTFFICGQ